MAKAYIGTSGWHYKHWRGPFYPTDLPVARWFAYYCEHFATVEINNSFYHLLPAESVKDWYAQAPKDFVFVVKGSRYITHNKKLKDGQSLGRFTDSITGFKDKLGPILFQLPPGWRCNAERLEEFLGRLPKGRRYAFEFRNPTWHDPAVYTLLARHGAAFCIYHMGDYASPTQVTADFVYLRLHGSAKFGGSYTDRELAEWADAIRAWKRRRKDVYVYFNNDPEGNAVRNAKTLIGLVDRRRRA